MVGLFARKELGICNPPCTERVANPDTQGSRIANSTEREVFIYSFREGFRALSPLPKQGGVGGESWEG